MNIFVVGNTANKPRKILNSVLALATGVLAILWPEFLYYIVGGYLIATGIIFVAFQFSIALAAVAIVTGIFVLNFPNLIPYAFAFFLLMFGLSMLFSGGFAILGVISLLSAMVLISAPGIVAYIVAAFLMFYGVFNIMLLIQKKDSF